MEFADYLKSFLGLLAIVDPLIAVPLFLALTPSVSSRDRNRNCIAAISVLFILEGGTLQ
jgi:small neutral amino acid transporter SnatA (MarC family)